jgi:hypothetical protein
MPSIGLSELTAVASPRKHHYVAAFYQRNFINENGQLWVYDRWRQRYTELNPTSVCAETDLYSLKRDGANDPLVEIKVLGPVDDMGATSIRRLRDEGMVDRAAIACFVGFQSTRLPSTAKIIRELHERAADAIMRMTAATEERMQATIDNYVRDTGKNIDVSAKSLVEAVQQNQLHVTANKSVSLESMVEQAKLVSNFLETLPWQILEAPVDSGFIICDNPVTVVPPWGVDNIGFGIPGTVIYFPLTRRLCLRAGGIGPKLATRPINRDITQVINRNIAANSERFMMGPLKGQLETIIGQTDTAERPSGPRASIEVDGTPLTGGTIQLKVHPRDHFYLHTNDTA